MSERKSDVEALVVAGRIGFAWFDEELLDRAVR